MFEKSNSDYGKQALMRIEDLESRFNFQLSKLSNTSAVLSGSPCVVLDDRVVIVGTLLCRVSRLVLYLNIL
ncbi:MAG: hypothetical protein FWF56_06800 [Firmicutes bacterium]|nr:hypothetical protein [Bacillota bacterium]MCL1953968.1 hypothetical protein [Bacillota bacterium]